MKQEQYRRVQTIAVAAGVVSFLMSLMGGALESPFLARTGLAGFLLALATVIAFGVSAWRRFD
jgi:hypothetical protein